MKYVTKPPPIDVGGRTLSFEDFAKFLVGTSAHFNRTGNGIRAGIRIEDACERDAKKHYLELMMEHWQLLNEAAESPTGGFPVLKGTNGQGAPVEVSIARECLPFVDAIAAASDEPPPAVSDVAA